MWKSVWTKYARFDKTIVSRKILPKNSENEEHWNEPILTFVILQINVGILLLVKRVFCFIYTATARVIIL